MSSRLIGDLILMNFKFQAKKINMKKWHSFCTVVLFFMTSVFFIHAQPYPEFSCVAYYIHPEEQAAKNIFYHVKFTHDSSFGNYSSHQNFIDNHQRYVYTELQKCLILSCNDRTSAI